MKPSICIKALIQYTLLKVTSLTFKRIFAKEFVP